MNKEISLRTLLPDDAESISTLHFSAFKGFFLTTLGLTFLRVFYRCVLSQSDAIGVGAFESGILIGFAVGTQESSGFYRNVLKRNWLKLGWAAWPNLIFKPNRIKQLFKSLTGKSGDRYEGVPMLLSICVSSTQESKGIGKSLLFAFENELKKLNHKSLILSTDAHNNDYANKFYHHNNYTLLKSYSQGKREMNLYVKKLDI